MTDNLPHIFLLLASLSGWVYSATPLLNYMVFAAEKDFRWPLAGWFLCITICIFSARYSLFSLLAWPPPSTWASRLFYPFFLFSAYTIPFIKEIIRSKLKK